MRSRCCWVYMEERCLHPERNKSPSLRWSSPMVQQTHNINTWSKNTGSPTGTGYDQTLSWCVTTDQAGTGLHHGQGRLPQRPLACWLCSAAAWTRPQLQSKKGRKRGCGSAEQSAALWALITLGVRGCSITGLCPEHDVQIFGQSFSCAESKVTENRRVTQNGFGGSPMTSHSSLTRPAGSGVFQMVSMDGFGA